MITTTHVNMKGCLVLDDGSVNYYLDPDDWSLKADGTASTLTGADGQVMVEIPAFWTKRTKVGTITTWEIADRATSGFNLHPAFVKDGAAVSHRYVGAYTACYYDDSDSAYESGLNEDVHTVDTADDVLASVKGVYPICGVTRATCRALAANRGAGWRQLDYALWCAINLLYLIEYQTFYSQDELGNGNIAGSYLPSSSNQNDSPHTIAGAGDAWGNGSTDGTQPSAGAKPGTAYMKYRGIENWFGNAYQWVDGINLNVNASGDVYVSNTTADFADNTDTNYTLIASDWDTSGSDWQTDFSDIDDYFISNASSGGSSSTYITDYNYNNTSADRVVTVGGAANSSALAGAFAFLGQESSSASANSFSARLAR
jgi:hypothetical protein